MNSTPQTWVEYLLLHLTPHLTCTLRIDSSTGSAVMSTASSTTAVGKTRAVNMAVVQALETWFLSSPMRRPHLTTEEQEARFVQFVKTLQDNKPAQTVVHTLCCLLFPPPPPTASTA